MTAGTLPDEESIRRFVCGLRPGGAAEKMASHDCLLCLPGMPPMQLTALLQIKADILRAFPRWETVCHGVQKNNDGSYTVLTQQHVGPMQHDLPAMGPFPPVSVESVSSIMQVDLNLPVEVGTFTMVDGKVMAVEYTGETRVLPGVDVTPAIGDIWNKKGNQFMGLHCLYMLLDVAVPDTDQVWSSLPSPATHHSFDQDLQMHAPVNPGKGDDHSGDNTEMFRPTPMLDCCDSDKTGLTDDSASNQRASDDLGSRKRDLFRARITRSRLVALGVLAVLILLIASVPSMPDPKPEGAIVHITFSDQGSILFNATATMVPTSSSFLGGTSFHALVMRSTACTVFHEDDKMSKKLGLRWVEVDSFDKDFEPTGNEIKNAALALALQQKTKFSQQEFDTFGISDDVLDDSYIHASGKYFRPLGKIPVGRAFVKGPLQLLATSAPDILSDSVVQSLSGYVNITDFEETVSMSNLKGTMVAECSIILDVDLYWGMISFPFHHGLTERVHAQTLSQAASAVAKHTDFDSLKEIIKDLPKSFSFERKDLDNTISHQRGDRRAGEEKESFSGEMAPLGISFKPNLPCIVESTGLIQELYIHLQPDVVLNMSATFLPQLQAKNEVKPELNNDVAAAAVLPFSWLLVRGDKKREPKWAIDGGQWVSVLHREEDEKFFFIRDGTEITVDSKTPVVYTRHKPSENSTKATSLFEGYKEWAKPADRPRAQFFFTCAGGCGLHTLKTLAETVLNALTTHPVREIGVGVTASPASSAFFNNLVGQNAALMRIPLKSRPSGVMGRRGLKAPDSCVSLVLWMWTIENCLTLSENQGNEDLIKHLPSASVTVAENEYFEDESGEMLLYVHGIFTQVQRATHERTTSLADFDVVTGKRSHSNGTLVSMTPNNTRYNPNSILVSCDVDVDILDMKSRNTLQLELGRTHGMSRQGVNESKLYLVLQHHNQEQESMEWEWVVTAVAQSAHSEQHFSPVDWVVSSKLIVYEGIFSSTLIEVYKLHGSLLINITEGRLVNSLQAQVLCAVKLLNYDTINGLVGANVSWGDQISVDVVMRDRDKDEEIVQASASTTGMREGDESLTTQSNIEVHVKISDTEHLSAKGLLQGHLQLDIYNCERFETLNGSNRSLPSFQFKTLNGSNRSLPSFQFETLNGSSQCERFETLNGNMFGEIKIDDRNILLSQGRIKLSLEEPQVFDMHGSGKVVVGDESIADMGMKVQARWPEEDESGTKRYAGMMGLMSGDKEVIGMDAGIHVDLQDATNDLLQARGLQGGGAVQVRVDGNEVIDGSGKVNVSWEDGLMVGASMSDGNSVEVVGISGIARGSMADKATTGHGMLQVRSRDQTVFLSEGRLGLSLEEPQMWIVLGRVGDLDSMFYQVFDMHGSGKVVVGDESIADMGMKVQARWPEEGVEGTKRYAGTMGLMSGDKEVIGMDAGIHGDLQEARGLQGGGAVQVRVDGNEVIDGSGKVNVSWEEGWSFESSLGMGDEVEYVVNAFAVVRGVPNISPATFFNHYLQEERILDILMYVDMLDAGQIHLTGNLTSSDLRANHDYAVRQVIDYRARKMSCLQFEAESSGFANTGASTDFRFTNFSSLWASPLEHAKVSFFFETHHDSFEATNSIYSQPPSCNATSGGKLLMVIGTMSCPEGYFKQKGSCLACTKSACNVGFFRGVCRSYSDAACKACTTKPKNARYLTSGQPWDADNCTWMCEKGFWRSGDSCVSCTAALCPAGHYRGSCDADHDAPCHACNISLIPKHSHFTGSEEPYACAWSCNAGYNDTVDGKCVPSTAPDIGISALPPDSSPFLRMKIQIPASLVSISRALELAYCTSISVVMGIDVSNVRVVSISEDVGTNCSHSGSCVVLGILIHVPTNCSCALYPDVCRDHAQHLGDMLALEGLNQELHHRNLPRLEIQQPPVLEFALAAAIQNMYWGDPAFIHCQCNLTMKELRQRKKHALSPRYRTGGLGRRITRSIWEVWICTDSYHGCPSAVDQWFCFVVDERIALPQERAPQQYVPWGYNANLKLFPSV